MNSGNLMTFRFNPCKNHQLTIRRKREAEAQQVPNRKEKVEAELNRAPKRLQRTPELRRNTPKP